MDAKIEGVNIAKQIFSNDNRLNYTLIKKEELEDEERGTRLPEWLDRDKIDYDVVVKKVEETEDYTVGMGKLDETLPASYCGIKTLEEGIEWYKHKYPDYPDDFIEILARYQWGSNQKNYQKKLRRRKRKIKRR